MAWEENPRICLHMQLIAILSRTEVIRRRYEMEQEAAMRDSIGRLMIQQSKDIGKKMK